MHNRWQIWMAMTLVTILFVACIVAMLKIDITPAEEKQGPVVRERNFGEGINVSQHGVYDFDLISIGKARMRKLRKGPFSIGAINELVLTEVSLALPEEMWKGEGEAQKAAEPTEERGPKAVLAKLGIDAGHIKMGGKIPKFSALTIKNLKVARIVDKTNAIPWFVASRAKAERAGLALADGWSVENGVSNRWKKALFEVAPKMELHWM